MDSALIRGPASSSVSGSAGGLASVQSQVSVVTMADLVKAYEVMDQASYQQAVRVVEAQIGVAGRAASAECAALRRASGGSVRSSSGLGSGVSAGSRTSGGGSRVASIRRAASWRAKVVPEGFCYTKMLKASAAEQVAHRLGQWPALSSLLSSPVGVFKSLDDLEAFRVVGGSEGVHVVESGVEGSSMLSSFARVAQGFKTSPGTFGAVLRASGQRPDASAVRVGARTMVGGLMGPCGAGGPEVAALDSLAFCGAFGAGAGRPPVGVADLRGLGVAAPSSRRVDGFRSLGDVVCPGGVLRRGIASGRLGFDTTGLKMSVELGCFGGGVGVMSVPAGSSVWDGNSWRSDLEFVLVTSDTVLSLLTWTRYASLWFSFVVGEVSDPSSPVLGEVGEARVRCSACGGKASCVCDLAADRELWDWSDVAGDISCSRCGFSVENCSGCGGKGWTVV